MKFRKEGNVTFIEDNYLDMDAPSKKQTVQISPVWDKCVEIKIWTGDNEGGKVTTENETHLRFYDQDTFHQFITMLQAEQYLKERWKEKSLREQQEKQNLNEPTLAAESKENSAIVTNGEEIWKDL